MTRLRSEPQGTSERRGGLRSRGRRAGLRAFVVLLVLAAGHPVHGAAQSGEAAHVAPPPVHYEIRFPNIDHHEARVSIEYRYVTPGPFEVRMSRSSPGRYALHEFAKNVYDVRALDERGRPLRVTQPDPYGWVVHDHAGFVRFEYTLFGDRADGTYAAFDRSHAHMNMPATFAWARGLEARPILLRVVPPEGADWTVATQLAPTGDSLLFAAPDLEYFLDSPTIAGALDWHTWTVGEGSAAQTMRVALLHDGDADDARRYVEGVKAIVAQADDLFGGYPRFDFGTYTFLASYLPWIAGDGMEHRNSTMLTSSLSIERNVLRLWGTVAHEFIHAWNIERLRPADLQPFDFERANMSEALWFGEGFTSYLDDVLLARAGLLDLEDFAARLGGAVSSVTNAPGRRHFDVLAMSRQAPFVDAAVSIDPQNRANTFISYYTWGNVIGAALDLELRARGHSLDEVMRAMWERYGAPEIPYTVPDLERVVGEVAGDEDFARGFFDRYVRGAEVADFAPLLAPAGLLIERARPDAPWWGAQGWSDAPGGGARLDGVVEGGPLYRADLDRLDVVTAVDGRAVDDARALRAALEARAPGEAVTLSVRSRGRTFEARVVAAA
ncbi:MAG: M61 family peptidase, partial [Gemmatimonadetes bacterium]